VQTSCTDLDYPTSAAAFEAVGRRAAEEAPFIGLQNNWGESAPGWVCGLWPVEANDRYLGPFRYDGRTPALVVGTTYDPAPPISFARALVAQLGRARLLTMDGDGHTAYGGNSSCIDPAVDAYLETLILPPRGTVCPQDLVVDPTPEELAGAGALAAAQRHARDGLSRRERNRLELAVAAP
jgi:TAP-like protein